MRGPAVPAAVGQIRGADGGVLGAGFVVGDGLVVTCAHVLANNGYGPGDRVQVAFPRLAGAPTVWGAVLVEPWRGPGADDVAFIRLVEVPMGAVALPLGSAAGCCGHRVRSFGFPAQAPVEGHFGFGIVGDLLPGERLLVQLTDANDLTLGFSGGPVVDEVRGVVIGMVTAITAPDSRNRGLNVAYATPAEALREVLREAWPEPAGDEVCPYRGLEPFTAQHAEWFHGRESVVRDVVGRLAGSRRAVLVLGPSGSGKSSLIQAGVLPALANGAVPGSDRWLPVIVRPGADVLAELDAAGASGVAENGILAAVDRLLAADPAHERVVLVVDQFEELLTSPRDDSGRPDAHLAVLARLTEAIETPAPLTVVLVMRDDFYPRLATLAPDLLNSTALATYNLPATLDANALRTIITTPAAALGARYEDGLPDRILADILAADHDSPALRAPVTVLPLLELALTQLWLRREDGYLTHDAYQRIGQVAGSLTIWCDTALRRLPAEHRSVAQRILTALVRPADERHHIPAVGHPVPLTTLRDLAADITDTTSVDTIDEVLGALTHQRVITTRAVDTAHAVGEPVAELVHDALIRDWDTLRQWVEQDHRFHDWLHRATDQHHRWSNHNGDLLHGTDLAEGRAWSRQRQLPRDITAFLRASRRRDRRTKTLAFSVLSWLIVVAVTIAVFAFSQRNTAVTAQKVAVSRELAAQSAALVDTDPDLASLLAVEAYRTSHTAEATGSLYRAAELPLTHRLAGHRGPVTAVVFSPDAHTLATAGYDGTARLWDARTGTPRATLTGRYGPVTSVVFSSDGHTLATTSLGGRVLLWDAETREDRTLAGHSSPVTSVVFSSDGHTLATADNDGTAGLWDVHTGTARRVLTGHRGPVATVSFSPDGRTLATASLDGTARLWDTRTGTTRATLTGHKGPVTSVTFSPDGHTLATASLDGTARLWDTRTGTTRATLTGHSGPVRAVAFGPDGRTLATASLDGTARTWDTRTGTPRATVTGHSGPVRAVVFSPDGHTVATTSDDDTARLSDAETGAPRAILTGHSGPVTSVAFSPDGHTLATASLDSTARLWNAQAGTPRATLNGHSGPVTSVAFSPDGRTLATANLDGTARLWNGDTGTIRATLTGNGDGSVTSVAFSPDRTTLATANDNGTARLWDARTGAPRTTSLTEHSGPVTSVAFSPDGHTLATADDNGTARLWDARSGAPRATLTGNKDGPVSSVAFSPDGHTLATANNDRRTRLWNIDTGRIRATLTGPEDRPVTSVAFSPDGHTLATANDDGTARLWDVDTRELQGTLTGHNGPVRAVAFSPDGRTLATASDDRTARLWDVGTRTIRSTLAGHDGPVTSVAFGPDRTTLATASLDGTARLWTITLPGPTDSIQKICQAVGRDLTRQERSLYLPDQTPGTTCRP